MAEKDKLEEELEIATLVEQLETLRPATEKKSRTAEDLAARREIVDKLAALNAAFNEKYAPVATAPEDGTATPETVAAEIKGSDSE